MLKARRFAFLLAGTIFGYILPAPGYAQDPSLGLASTYILGNKLSFTANAMLADSLKKQSGAGLISNVNPLSDATELSLGADYRAPLAKDAEWSLQLRGRHNADHIEGRHGVEALLSTKLRF